MADLSVAGATVIVSVVAALSQAWSMRQQRQIAEINAKAQAAILAQSVANHEQGKEIAKATDGNLSRTQALLDLERMRSGGLQAQVDVTAHDKADAALATATAATPPHDRREGDG